MKNDKEIYKKAKGFDKNPQNINRTGANGKSISKIMKEILEENIIDIEITMTNEVGEKKTKKINLKTKTDLKTAIGMLLVQKAMSGDLKAIETILDRTEGKALQTIETKQEITTNEIDYSKLSTETLEKIEKDLNSK